MASTYLAIIATGDEAGGSWNNAKVYSDSNYNTAMAALTSGDGVFFVGDGTDIFDVSTQKTIPATGGRPGAIGVYGVSSTDGELADDIRAYLRWTGAGGTNMFIGGSNWFKFWGMKVANVDGSVFATGVRLGYSFYNCEFDNITGSVLLSTWDNVIWNNIITTNTDSHAIVQVRGSVVSNSTFILGAGSCLQGNDDTLFEDIIVHDYVTHGLANVVFVSGAVVDDCGHSAILVVGNKPITLKNARITNNLFGVNSLSYPSLISNVRYKDNGTDVAGSLAYPDMLIDEPSGQIAGSAYENVGAHNFNPPTDDPYTQVAIPIGALDGTINISYRAAGIQPAASGGGGNLIDGSLVG